MEQPKSPKRNITFIKKVKTSHPEWFTDCLASQKKQEESRKEADEQKWKEFKTFEERKIDLIESLIHAINGNKEK